jgi:uncharacterized protein YggE
MKRIALRNAAIAAVALFALGAAACTPTTQVTVAGPAEQTGISVTGEGTVSVRPDIARINLGVEVTAPTVAEARAGAADAMDAVQAALSANGVARDDVRTQYFNIYPQYVYPPDTGQPRITGFTVSNQVVVTVRNIDTSSDVLDAAIEAGGDAVRVNGISFTVDNPEQYLTQAREQAIANARSRAEVLANAAGVTLGTARTINESTTSFDGPYPAFERAAGAPTPVSPGEQELRVIVSVVFNIDQ